MECERVVKEQKRARRKKNPKAHFTHKLPKRRILWGRME
jgi:hypothetical protein